MKAILITALTLSIAFLAGCKTPVAIDPLTGQEQTAAYQAGYFYAPLEADIGEVFKAAIVELDDLGYFRTGELHKDNHITIYARKVGDEKVTVRAFYPSDSSKLPEGAKSMLRIRIGKMGNLAESQVVYARVRDAL
ncbi:MAG: DUF3568 family protein [Opitutales bacterium]